MITIFNRKELLVTMDMDKQANVRSILSNAKIDYQLKTNSVRTSSFPSPNARVLPSGMKQNYEYTFYVKKQDFDQAFYLISQ